MLKTETNTAAMERQVMKAAEDYFWSGPGERFHALSVHFEHGQWWVTCPACGAQWSVCDATGGRSVGGFDFEQVTEGDDYCRPEAK
jgi:hypothetical protein